MKIKFILEGEYEANPENYGTDDPVKMCEMDLVNAQDDPFIFIDMLESIKITLTPKEGWK